VPASAFVDAGAPIGRTADPGKWGRVPKYNEAAIQFCLTIKGLFNLLLRQAMGMAQSLLELAGLDWRVPQVLRHHWYLDVCEFIITYDDEAGRRHFACG
jgi:hypothetical protein